MSEDRGAAKREQTLERQCPDGRRLYRRRPVRPPRARRKRQDALRRCDRDNRRWQARSKSSFGPSKGIVTLASFTCQWRDALMGRTQRNQWLAEFESGAGRLENPLFLADVTMPSYALCLVALILKITPMRRQFKSVR